MSIFHTHFGLPVALYVLFSSGNAFAADTVVPKSRGDCPDGYRSYKGYCQPRSSTAKNVVVRNERGSCPRGYSAKKGYCYKYSDFSGDAIEKIGDQCPKSYSRYKGYCQKR